MGWHGSPRGGANVNGRILFEIRPERDGRAEDERRAIHKLTMSAESCPRRARLMAAGVKAAERASSTKPTWRAAARAKRDVQPRVQGDRQLDNHVAAGRPRDIARIYTSC